MGCSKTKFKDIMEKKMSQFFLRIIRHDFVVSHIEEYLKKPAKTDYEFLNLTKHLGIHSDINFQNTFWEKCYLTFKDDYGIDGILFIPLLLCKGDIYTKLSYIKQYLSININHSKEYNEKSLIMNLKEFHNILFCYLSCLTHIAFVSYTEIHLIDETGGNNKEMRKYALCFSSGQIENFTRRLLRPYSKKNFYVNAGKFLDDYISLLVNDKEIRKLINEWFEKGKHQEDIMEKMKNEIEHPTEEDAKNEKNIQDNDENINENEHNNNDNTDDSQK